MFVVDDPSSAVEVAEVCGPIAPHMIQGQGAREPNPQDKVVRTFGAQCVEVKVDVETGEVTVLRVAAAHDCGRVINPTMVESQVIGGVTQGLGFALTEERVVDARRGLVLNANPEEYNVPTVAAIASAIFDAVGVRLRHGPLTRRRLVAALAEQGAQQPGAQGGER